MHHKNVENPPRGFIFHLCFIRPPTLERAPGGRDHTRVGCVPTAVCTDIVVVRGDGGDVNQGCRAELVVCSMPEPTHVRRSPTVSGSECCDLACIVVCFVVLRLLGNLSGNVAVCVVMYAWQAKNMNAPGEVFAPGQFVIPVKRSPRYTLENARGGSFSKSLWDRPPGRSQRILRYRRLAI